MKLKDHFKVTYQETGSLWQSFATLLPDFLAQWPRRLLPFLPKNVKFWLSYLHASPTGGRLIGKSWERHILQDHRSHPPGTYQLFPEGAIMLFSGGLDSFIMWRLLDMPDIVYFTIGHRSEKKELETIDRILNHPDIKFSGNFYIDRRLQLEEDVETGYILFRNLLFILLAAKYAKTIILNSMLEYAPDKNQKFFNRTERLMNLSGTSSQWHRLDYRRFRILTPFKYFTKTQLLTMYKKAFNDDLFKLTYSCYKGEDVHCGQCHGCIARAIAFRNLGVSEEYQQTPPLGRRRKEVLTYWRDFKFSLLYMYLSRYLEWRRALRKESK